MTDEEINAALSAITEQEKLYGTNPEMRAQKVVEDWAIICSSPLAAVELESLEKSVTETISDVKRRAELVALRQAARILGISNGMTDSNGLPLMTGLEIKTAMHMLAKGGANV